MEEGVMDKIGKRLRPFLDTSQKYKHRLTALLMFFGKPHGEGL